MGTCDIVADGTLTGLVPGVIGPWCGQSVGTSAAGAPDTITYTDILTGATKAYTTSVAWVSAGSVVLLTGTASKGGQGGPLAALAAATGNPFNFPPPTSCLPPGATEFIVVGVAAGTALGTK